MLSDPSVTPAEITASVFELERIAGVSEQEPIASEPLAGREALRALDGGVIQMLAGACARCICTRGTPYCERTVGVRH